MGEWADYYTDRAMSAEENVEDVRFLLRELLNLIERDKIDKKKIKNIIDKLETHTMEYGHRILELNEDVSNANEAAMSAGEELHKQKEEHYMIGLSSNELYTFEEFKTLSEKHLSAEGAFLPISLDTFDSFIEQMTPKQIKKNRDILEKQQKEDLLKGFN